MGRSIKTGYLIAALCVAMAFLIFVLALAKSDLGIVSTTAILAVGVVLSRKKK